MSPTDADRRAGLNRQLLDASAWMLVFIAWLIASASTLGALFFGEVMQLPPCSLCWYQRIFMFPLALILPFGLFPYDRGVVRAALPLAGIGALVAAFQVLLVAGIIPARLEPCKQGVPCSETVIEWFGFVTIPLLSFVAFAAIAAMLTFAYYRSSK
ncbi:MAG: disulfide bond formation protein B [Gemmatimonadaceae bacterium]|nr:disulfide bond formation protein B [Gemmatimonadaceae bacterium]